MPLTEKLHPTRFTAMSGRMAAILGFVLSQTWTMPRMQELHITSDGFLMARSSEDIGCNDFIGAVADWDSNLQRLFGVAEVTPDERQEFAGLWQLRVKDWRVAR